MRSSGTKEEFLNAFIHGLFLEPADEDYLFARVAWKMGFVRQFHWSACQAVEKYLKCIFLLSNRSADFGHDWFDAFITADKCAFLPVAAFPKILYSPWDEPTPNAVETVDFMCRLSKAGAAAVRYNEVPYNDLDFHDIFYLDELCCWLRCFAVIDWGKSPTDETLVPHKFSGVYMDKKIESEFRKDNKRFFPDSAELLQPKLSWKTSAPEMTMRIARHDLSAQNVDWVFREYVSRWNRSAKPQAQQKMLSKLKRFGQTEPQ